DLGADGNLQHHVVGAAACALATGAALAVAGKEMLLIAIVDEGIQPIDGLGPDIAALAAVAAIRAAELDVFLAAEADGAVAPGTGAKVDAREVEKFHRATCAASRRR